MEKIILTEQGKKDLEARLKVLKNELIPEVVQRIKTAKEQGDLSENAEYHSARDEQAKLEGEAQEIQNILKFGEVFVATEKDIVQVGSTVKYLDIDEEEEFTFTMVGTTEADLSKGKMSIESPIGQAMLNKKAGDTVVVKTPRCGEYSVKILEIID